MNLYDTVAPRHDARPLGLIIDDLRLMIVGAEYIVTLAPGIPEHHFLKGSLS
jgi:hypothetical protein